MKFRVRRPMAKYRALQRWHKWFAWYPVRVRINGRSERMVWLETIERRIFVYHPRLSIPYYTVTKEYRFPKKETNTNAK